MTPQEELFRKLYNDYKTRPEVNAMSDLELRVLREELSDIAYTAKVRIGAVDDILKERKPKGPQGFKTSVNDNAFATDAINKVKERQTKLTKADKMRAGFLKLGIDPESVEKIMSAKNILDVTKTRAQNHSKEGLVNNPEEKKEEQTGEKRPIFNPFAKK